jgi:transcriptional regulator with GAF, ATPase, and Fis domain
MVGGEDLHGLGRRGRDVQEFADAGEGERAIEGAVLGDDDVRPAWARLDLLHRANQRSRAGGVAEADGPQIERYDRRRGRRGALLQRVAQRRRQLALANALGARLAGMSDAPAIAEITVEELRRAFGYHVSAVLRVRADECVEAVAVRGDRFDALQLRRWRQPHEQGLIGRCLRERPPVLVNDVRTEPDYAHTPETAAVCAELVVPLLVDGKVWGTINVEETACDAFDHDDVILLSTLANQVGAALRAAALLRRLEEAEAVAGRVEPPGAG